MATTVNLAMMVLSADMIDNVGEIIRNTFSHTCNMLFIESGSISFSCSKTQYTAQPGDILIYTDRDYDIDFLPGGQPFKAYLIILNEIALKTIQDKAEDVCRYMPCIKFNGKEECVSAFRWSFRCICEEVAHKYNGYEAIVSNHIMIIINLIARFVQAMDYVAMAAGQNKDVCQSIKDYIEKNFSEDISIESMANDFYISYNYLSRLFKRRIGCSPINYLIMVRMGCAKKLLVTTDLSVQDISIAIGYDNANYFSMVFKKNVGMSPTEYRLSSQRHV